MEGVFDKSHNINHPEKGRAGIFLSCVTPLSRNKSYESFYLKPLLLQHLKTKRLAFC